MRVLPIIIVFAGVLTFASCRKSDITVKTPTGLSDTSKTVSSVPDPNVIPFKNMLGIDGYEWDFLQDPSNPNDGSKIYAPKMALIDGFSAFRHYLDWSKIEPSQDQFTYNPAFNGSWNYDVMYQRANQDGVLMLVDLKTCPDWLLTSYPEGLQDSEDVPAPYGLNRSDPASYIAQAKAAFQFAARYGSNTQVSSSLVTVDAQTRWSGDPANTVKIGLNTVKYLECDNERDKWWKGPQAQQSAQEYAANMSAFYDGNRGKLGKNVGVKTADPNMLVVMGGLASANVQFVKDMVSWCKTNRGYRADGSVDLCFDVINYHFYASDGNVLTGKNGTVGVAPELSIAASIADSFVAEAVSLPGHPQVWVTENGYDINQASVQRAIAIGDKTPLLTQADWAVRSALLYARHGVNRLFFYQLFDDQTNGTGTYQTAGLANSDLTRRPAADYMLQLKTLMGNYSYSRTDSTDPLVDEYVSGNNSMYALTIPDQKNRTANYVLDLGSATSATIYTLTPGSSSMSKSTVKTQNGKLTIKVTETPVFVQKA